MHLFKRHGVGDHQAAAGQIPVIDYGRYFAGAPGALESVAAEVAHACENVGFFYALNHGVPDELIDRAFAASRRFHSLPLEQKLAVRLNENNIGYLAIATPRCRGASTVHKATKPNPTTKAFLSATTAGRSIPTLSPASHCAAATSGRRPFLTSAPI
jgi:isopenicillin N synthase-like dioxygenase